MSTITHSGWQTGFLNILPAVQTHAKISFRKLPAEKRQDAVQEAIAAAVMAYQRLVVQGRLHVAHPGTIATNAVHYVRNGRHVGGRQDTAKDPLSPACRKRHGINVISVHAHRPGIGKTDGWKQIAIEDRSIPIPDLAAFRIDFAEWLRSLTHRDRKIIGAFASGERTSDVAAKFGITEGRVSQLRRKFEHLWHVFRGEPTFAAA